MYVTYIYIYNVCFVRRSSWCTRFNK